MTVCLPIRFDERVALSAEERTAVENLIAECKTTDGFDPCMKFDTHLNADRGLPAWRLAWAEPADLPGDAGVGQARPRILAGAACAFAPSRPEGEISACVAPVFRYQGIFTALYGSLADMLCRSGAVAVLLVCEGSAPAGTVIAARLGATLDHGEYLMSLPGHRLDGIAAPGDLRLVPVTPDDLDEFAELSAVVFGESIEDARTFAASVLADTGREQFFARASEGAVGMVAVAREGEGFMLHGLGVVPAFRGRGFGRAILDASLVVLRNRGVGAVSLEVDVDNVPALALYRSRGFAEESRADYWRIPDPCTAS